MFLSRNHLKVNLAVFLTVYTVTIVTHYIEKTTIICSPILTHYLVSLLLCQLIKNRSIDPSAKYESRKVMETGAGHLESASFFKGVQIKGVPVYTYRTYDLVSTGNKSSIQTKQEDRHITEGASQQN